MKHDGASSYYNRFSTAGSPEKGMKFTTPYADQSPNKNYNSERRITANFAFAMATHEEKVAKGHMSE